MPAGGQKQRGQSKARGTSRNANTTGNDARNNNKEDRHVRFETEAPRGPNSRPGSRNDRAPSAPRGRGRGAGITGRSNVSRGSKAPTGPRLGNHEVPRGGRTSLSDTITKQIANHLAPQPQAPKKDWTGVSKETRTENLKRARDKERADGIKNGTVPDPSKQMKLSEAITLVGTCQDMCPEYERAKRISRGEVWYEERDKRVEDTGFQATRKADESRMVKAFARSAAGQEEQLPSDLRPPHVLSATLDYLLDVVAGRADSLDQVHKFIWDRTRAIRNDFSIQQVSQPNDVRLAIRCYEIIARFHIISLHQMIDADGKRLRDFDPQQEREQLDKSILSLIQLYEDHKDTFRSENEPEFRAYQIIFQIQKPSPNLEDRIQCWDDQVVQDARVQHALTIYQAACNFYDKQGPLGAKEHRVARSNWMAFWDIIESPETSYLMGCVAEIYFPLMRRNALRVLWKAYRPKANAESADWSLEELAEVFGMDNEEQVAVFLDKFGFQMKEDEEGVQRVNLGSVFGAFPDPAIAQNCTGIVDEKQNGLKVPALAKNMDRQEALERGLVEDEDEDGGEAEEDDDGEDDTQKNDQSTLFVPESAKTPAQPANPLAAGSSSSPFNNPFASAAASSTAANPFSSVDSTQTTPQTQAQTPSLFDRIAKSSASNSSQDQAQPSPFQSAQGIGDNPFEAQFQRQQAAAEKFGQPAATATTEDAAAKQAERKAKEKAAKEQEMAKQAAQAKAAEEEQKRRIAVEAERAAAKERAAREMAEKRRQNALKAEEERRKIEEERQRVAAAQEAERRAKESARTQVFKEIARRMVLEPGGYLDQFVEYKAGPIIQQAQEQVIGEKLRIEAEGFRLAKLQQRYGARWKDVCRKRRHLRAGRERRARRKHGQEEREKRAHDTSVAIELQNFRRSQQDLRTSRHLSPPHLNGGRPSVRSTRPPLASSPASDHSSTFRNSSLRASHLRNTVNGNGNMATNSSPPSRSSVSSSNSPPVEAYKVTNGVLSRVQTSPPGSSANTSAPIPFDGLSYSEWMAKRRAEKSRPPVRDSISSSYFRMKALGLDPNANSLSPYYSAKSQSPPSLKRPRESESFNNSLIENGDLSPPAEARNGNPAIMPPPPPRKTARRSPPVKDGKSLSLNSSGDSSNVVQAATTTEDDDEFLRQINEIKNVLGESEEWYRSERQAEEESRSRRSSRRASVSGFSPGRLEGQQQWAGHPADASLRKVSSSHHNSRWEPYGRSVSRGSANQEKEPDPTPPPMAPLRYRARQSKFLPRDQYADARAARGEEMFIGSVRATETATSPPSVEHNYERNGSGTRSKSPAQASNFYGGAQGNDVVGRATSNSIDLDALPDHQSSDQNGTKVSLDKEASPQSPPPVKHPTEKPDSNRGSFFNMSQTLDGTPSFGNTDIFSGFGTDATIAPMATMSPSFTPSNTKQAKSSPPQASPQPPKESSPETQVHQSHTNGHSTQPTGPFATESAHQNPFTQPSQYAQHNPFSTSSTNNSLAPNSAKKNPFSSSASPNSNPFASQKTHSQSQTPSQPLSSATKENAKTNKSNSNPFQSSQRVSSSLSVGAMRGGGKGKRNTSFAEGPGNPFAALADVDGESSTSSSDDNKDGNENDDENEDEDEEENADGEEGGGDENELVDATEQFAQTDSLIRDVRDEDEEDGDEEEMFDESSVGFSDDDGEGDVDGDGDGVGSDAEGEEEDIGDEDEAGPGAGNGGVGMVNGKSGASVEDAIEL